MLDIKAAIFDMDGTLVDSLMLWDILTEAMEKAYPDKIGTVISEEDNKAIRVVPLREGMQLLHDHYGIAASGEELFQLATDTFADFYANRVQLKPGVREFLDHLQSRGVRMCIASATNPDLIESALDHCGIRHYFETVFSCGVLGKGKDTPDIYLMARDYLGADTEHTWVFEDAFVAIQTATGIGMQTVGIYDKYNPYQDKIKAMSTHYIESGETLMKLV